MEYGWQRFVTMCLIDETNRIGFQHEIERTSKMFEDRMVYSPELIGPEDLKECGKRVCLVPRCSRCGQPTGGR